jgi:hypothetical protein
MNGWLASALAGSGARPSFVPIGNGGMPARAARDFKLGADSHLIAGKLMDTVFRTSRPDWKPPLPWQLLMTPESP